MLNKNKYPLVPMFGSLLAGHSSDSRQKRYFIYPVRLDPELPEGEHFVI